MNEGTRKQQFFYQAVGFSRQKIYEAQSQQQEFVLGGKDIGFVVKHLTLCPAGALLYGALYMKGLVYMYIPNMEKIYVIFAHLGWVGLNT